MKRSDINRIIRESDQFIRSFGFILPPFAYFAPQALKNQVQQHARIIRDHRLGWDITDYGQGKFDELGLFLFTLRNGRAEDLTRGSGQLYAEKIMISRHYQLSPMHRHNLKAEDIINRGGATLVIELFQARSDGWIDPDADVKVASDGRMVTLPAGGHLKLQPGESVTLLPQHWHAFWGEGGYVLVGEVSTVNDDLTDNVFRDPIGRFSQVEEDEAPLHLLVSDYDHWLA
ncbi:D-lyxose/D-mannose family sugar isomerase [Paenochrobactrum pullorum]|uniref:D-lyxose/D-mannose family sugar isomerase n=1 Tax=Paenochrobactrum pullorum TaxID=1324351 RepID=UPI0035BC1577